MLKTKHNIIAISILGIALAIVIVVVGGVSWHRASAPVTQPQTAENNPSATGTATSTATSTLAAKVYTPHPPHGSVTYQIAQAATQLPGFVQATIDPVDVSVGQVQHFTIVTDDPNPIVSVVAQITTDHKVLTVPLVSQGAPSVSMLVPRTITVNSDNQLALITPGQGGANADAINVKKGANVANAATANETKFTGQWTVEDTHTARYKTIFTAKDSAGNINSVTVDWTDPLCSFTSVNNYSAGTSTISSGCTMPYSSTPDGVSNVDGPEHGNLLISSGATLTISSSTTLVINGGYNLSFSGGGAVLVASGAQIVFGQDMCGTDNDGDGYIAGANWSTSCSGMVSRVNLAVGGFSDCNDTNANVHPGQTAMFSTPTTTDLGANTYDYNCDGVVSYKYGPSTVIGNQSCAGSDNCPGDGNCATNPGTNTSLGSTPACGAYITYGHSCSVGGSQGLCSGNNIRYTCTLSSLVEAQGCN
jgi:hypothetical protein